MCRFRHIQSCCLSRVWQDMRDDLGAGIFTIETEMSLRGGERLKSRCCSWGTDRGSRAADDKWIVTRDSGRSLDGEI